MKIQKNSSLRKLIIISFVLLSILPVLILGFIFYFQSLRQAQETYSRQMTESITKIDSYIFNLFEDLGHLSDSFVNLEPIKNANGHITSYVNLKANTANNKIKMDPDAFHHKEKEIFDIMKAFVHPFPSITFLTIATQKDGGILMYPPRDRSVGYDARERSWYKNCANSPKNRMLSGLYISSANDVSIEILTKIQSNGKFQGVFDTSVDLSYVQKLADQYKIGDDSHVVIVDKDNTIITHTDNKNAIGKKLSELNENYLKIAESASDSTPSSDEHGINFSKISMNGVNYLGQHLKSKNSDLNWTYFILLKESKLNNVKQKIFINTATVILILLILIITITFFISNGSLKLINNISSSLDKMAEGDFRVSLPPVKIREINNITQHFNTAVAKLSSLINSVAMNTGDVKNSAEHFQEISDNLSKELAETSEKSNKVTSAAEDMNDKISSISNGVSVSSSNVSNIAAAAQDMMKTIDEIAKNSENAAKITENAVNVVEKTSVHISSLEDSAQDIAKVVETIADISDQTNLLALNATIEAARAGEAGKGFAVVANEIKELAMQTNMATDGIKKRIEGIQGTTGNAVTGIENLSDVIKSVNDMVTAIASAVDQQSENTRQISQNVSEVSSELNDVNENVSDITQATSNIANDIREVNNNTNNISKSGEEILNSSKELKTFSEKLKEIVDQFKI